MITCSSAECFCMIIDGHSVLEHPHPFLAIMLQRRNRNGFRGGAQISLRKRTRPLFPRAAAPRGLDPHFLLGLYPVVSAVRTPDRSNKKTDRRYHSTGRPRIEDMTCRRPAPWQRRVERRLQQHRPALPPLQARRRSQSQTAIFSFQSRSLKIGPKPSSWIYDVATSGKIDFLDQAYLRDG
jgi:hypothetical protein